MMSLTLTLILILIFNTGEVQFFFLVLINKKNCFEEHLLYWKMINIQPHHNFGTTPTHNEVEPTCMGPTSL